jgi:hypothetical protein
MIVTFLFGFPYPARWGWNKYYLKHQHRAHLVRRERFADELATPTSIAQFVIPDDKLQFLSRIFQVWTPTPKRVSQRFLYRALRVWGLCKRFCQLFCIGMRRCIVRGLQLFENKVVRKISGPTGMNVVGSFRIWMASWGSWFVQAT